MGYEARNNKERDTHRVLVVCETTEGEKDFSAFAQRTAKMLEMVREFMGNACELDENDPALAAKMAPQVEKFIFELVTNYPHPKNLDLDIETLRQIKIRGRVI